MADITINAQNSPFNIPGGSVSYGKVTIEAGGYMQMLQQTKLTITTMVVSSGAGGSGTTLKASPKKTAGQKKKQYPGQL